MSFCNEIDGKRRCFSTGCCGNSRTSGRSGCSEARIPSCNCQSNVGCLDRSDCSILRPTETAATDTCPGPCQCVEEEIWNSNAPPKPNCQWLSNFAELRRQWSDHGRQRACKCCSCSRPCRTVAPCRPSLSPTAPCSGTILTTSDCQKCCGSHRLAGGASKSEMTPIDKSSSPERPLKREAGGGCPPPSCTYPSTRCNSPNTDCSSNASSCCPSQCRYSQASSHQTSECRPCASLALKPILKKRSCCQCNTSHCMCQPIPRGCNCPPPVQVDARTVHVACSCDCQSSPECGCPPRERRFPKTTVKCPNARPCCPLPRLPPAPKCHYARCQPCPPPPCDPCASKCRGSAPPKNPCRPCSPCPSYPLCRPALHASSCRPPTPSRKLTFCTERRSRPPSPCTRTGQSSREIIDDRNSEICSERNDVENQEKHETKDPDNSCDCCYATDCTESDDESDYPDESCDLILNEGSVENSKSTTLINSSEATNPSKSVDPDSYGVPKREDGSALENATEAFEGYTTEKSSKGSIQHTSSTYAPSDNDAKSDRYAFPGEHPPVGKNVSVNPVLARLSNRMRSAIRIKRQDLSAPNKLLPRQAVIFHDTPRARVRPFAGVSVSAPTTPSREIDRRRRNGGSSKEDAIDSNNLSREERVTRWNVSKLPSPTIRDHSASTSFRTNVTRGVVGPVGVSCTSEEISSTYAQTYEEKNGRTCRDMFSNLGGVGYSTFVPSPLALISFALLIFVAVTWSSGLTFYRCYLSRKKICWKYLGL